MEKKNGIHVRKGWFADYFAYAMWRMERLWGPDCIEFRLKRWLDDDRVFQPCDQFKFPAFHCGPWMSLGKEMAYVQMKSIAAAVMYEFEGAGGYQISLLADKGLIIWDNALEDCEALCRRFLLVIVVAEAEAD
ncbi:Uncharacterized protein Fot_55194 [Forsythia ovata]|uniref:Uncharacterized protein n=1 Tax=Forsythia ovata TaxID=205694 RepID=A0ABD1P938_9LAMI